MTSTNEIYQSEEFKSELRKCQIFRLKYPRGGQYNDGYKLLGKITLSDGKELLKALDTIGVTYFLYSQEPAEWCPPAFIVDTENCWMKYENQSKCFGFRTYITIGISDFSIEFNFNSTSWYDVTLDDVKQAICFEKALTSHDLLVVETEMKV